MANLVNPVPPTPATVPIDPCTNMAQEMEAVLLRECKSKKHHLHKCCECSTQSAAPKIRSHQDAVFLNTAYDGSDILAPPGPDLNWEFATSPGGPWAPAPVCGKATLAWSGILPTSSTWISMKANGNPGGIKNIFFRRKFTLCDGINPSDFKLTASYLADDEVKDIYVNGVAQSANMTIPGGAFTGKPKSVTLDKDWKKCENEIIFHIHSKMTFLGFAAGFTIAPIPISSQICDCRCESATLPDYKPCFSIGWGDKSEDKIYQDGCEILCITACNCYSNVRFEDVSIQKITILDAMGNPVQILSDGKPTVQVTPYSQICFGDIAPCSSKPNNLPNCKSRQIVIRTRGAAPGNYKIKLDMICYRVSYAAHSEECFELEVFKK